jgi:hypothetical protein
MIKSETESEFEFVIFDTNSAVLVVKGFPYRVLPDRIFFHWIPVLLLLVVFNLMILIFSRYGIIVKRKQRLGILKNTNYALGKTKMAVWFVSHCETVSDRER